MCLVKSVQFFLGIIQLVPSCSKADTETQFSFRAQKANSHSAIPLHLPSPILPACEVGIGGVPSFKCLWLQENSVLRFGCVAVVTALCLHKVR